MFDARHDEPGLAARIDQAQLDPLAGPREIERLAAESLELGVHAALCHGVHLPLLVRLLRHGRVRPGTVIGFPLGAAAPGAKLEEARLALAQGALELDMVLWIGGLRAGLEARVADEIAPVAELARASGAVLKGICETGVLEDHEKERAATLCREAGAHFVKTSTGFRGGGATPEDVALLRRTVGPDFGVKASGGIRTLARARALLEAGADRLGTSSAAALLAEEHEERRQP